MWVSRNIRCSIEEPRCANVMWTDLDIGQTHSLGLTLVHELVNQLQGTMQVDRLQGTTFTIHFQSIQLRGVVL